MAKERSIVGVHEESEKRSPVFRVARYFARVTATLAAGIVRGIIHGVWHLAYFLLCLFRPITYLFLPAAVITLLLAVAAFVKPETSPRMPAWAMLLMSIGFGAFSIAYAAFVDCVRPPGAVDPADRFRRPN
ncbi:hypothetical protein [Shinella zoogloeoides]|uniref:hypothetical protein n=1 Tax=Shinella zoogloeoides TaxID=352475 RepID=UPI0028A5B8AB|nr:hypothetical protein [Shinella zoogloeoides]